MGCDIHCYVEYKSPEAGSWSSFGGRINPGRNYRLFAALAGVRNYEEIVPAVPPRGYPKDASYAAADDYWVYIGDPEQAKRAAAWVESGYSIYNENKSHVSGPDWHSHSWLTTAEYAAILASCNKSVECKYRAVLAAMRSLEADGFQARIVFWFDN